MDTGQGNVDTGAWGGGGMPAGNQDYVDNGGWDQNTGSGDSSWTDDSGGGDSSWDSGGGIRRHAVGGPKIALTVLARLDRTISCSGVRGAWGRASLDRDAPGQAGP